MAKTANTKKALAAPKKSGQGGPGKPRKSRELSADINLSDTSRRICQNFRVIRTQAGLTQEKFADSIGVNLPYIKAVEQGRFSPADEVIFKVAKHYKRSIDWIYGLI